MDLTTSGLAGVNEKFNNILKKIESTTNTMKAQIQADASVASSAIGSDLSALTGELRSLIPQGAALPNINLQSQLSSLASISDPTQSANLLSSITSNFGTELSASGFNLDALVSNAKTAVAGGNSLSKTIPNFEKAADGVSAAFQKAVAVKVPDKDVIKETAATFVENTKLTAAKTTASSSVISVSTTPPTEDTTQIKITEKTTNITQQGITSKVTTSKNAVVTTTTSGGSKTISRKNFSKDGFVTKQIRVTEYIHVDDVDDPLSDAEMSFELSSKPIRIGKLKGFDQTTKRSKTIRSFPTRHPDRSDTFVVNGKKITISNIIGIDYDEFGENFLGKDYGYPDGTMFVVSYYTLSNYDPDYKTDEVEV